MPVLRLLSRVAFICNVCWLLASFIQWLPHPPEGEAVTSIIVMGYIGSIVSNLVVNVWVVAAFLVGRLRRQQVPVWLLVVNALFCLTQIFIFLHFQ